MLGNCIQPATKTFGVSNHSYKFTPILPTPQGGVEALLKQKQLNFIPVCLVSLAHENSIFRGIFDASPVLAR